MNTANAAAKLVLGVALLLCGAGCETLDSLGSMATNLVKSNFPSKDARIRLGHPEGGHLGRSGTQSLTRVTDPGAALVLVVENETGGMSHREDMAVVLRVSNPTAPALWLGVAGGRVGLVDGSAGPEYHTWMVEPLHVRDMGKPIMFGNLVRLRNRGANLYLRPTDAGAELLPQKGDAFWSFELAPVASTPPSTR